MFLIMNLLHCRYTFSELSNAKRKSKFHLVHNVQGAQDKLAKKLWESLFINVLINLNKNMVLSCTLILIDSI